VKLVHAFNGDTDWWPEKYLEDHTLFTSNGGHYAGASVLLDEGLAAMSRLYPEIEYVVVLASDTWCLFPEYIVNQINLMQQSKLYLEGVMKLRV
jgi:hypothetical protein